MAGQEVLGYKVDYSPCIPPVDLSAAAVTGKRVSMKANSCLVVKVDKGAATAGTDPGFTFKECTAASGGTSQAMATPPAYFYKKSAAALAGTETWVKVAATYSSGTVTLTGEEGNQGTYVFQILSSDLSAGFSYIEVDSVKAGTVAQLGTVSYEVYELLAERDPSNLAALGA